MALKKLCQLLVDIDKQATDSFIGLGLIVYQDWKPLPISSLQLNDGVINLPLTDYDEILKLLLQISILNHPFHDGFHLLSEDLELTRLSQYFAAPVVQNANIEYRFGSRYRAALYGSFLDEVYACGVISKTHGPVIFKNGEKIDPYYFLSG